MDVSAILGLTTTTAVVGGVVFGGWQLWVAARTRSTQIYLHMLETLYSPELIDGLMALREVPSGLSVAQLQARLADRWNEGFTAMVTFDGLGVLVYRGELSFRVADAFFHQSISLVWEKWRAAITDLRVERGDERLAEYLQWLAENQSVARIDPVRPAYLEPRRVRSRSKSVREPQAQIV
jgi:hypothetical protein